MGAGSPPTREEGDAACLAGFLSSWSLTARVLALVLLAHAWLAQLPSLLRLQASPTPSLLRVGPAAPQQHNFSLPPQVLLPPRSVEELLGILEGGLEPCATGDTAAVRVTWPAGAQLQPSGARRLALGRRHVFLVQALTAEGARVGCGGDYLEAQLEGERVRARPATTDHLDGTYAVEIDLPDDPLLAGPAALNLTLLLVHFAGMEEAPEARWRALAPHAAVFSAQLELVASPSAAPLRLPSCRDVDFMAAPFWSGHWVRLEPGGGACPRGACQGATSRLSAPWVYRLPTCAFELFSQAEARKCVAGSWLFLLGDSCNPYSVDNLFRHLLGVVDHPAVPSPIDMRTFDLIVTDWDSRSSDSAPPPAPPPWQARVGHIWMGGWSVSDNGAGLSMMHERDRLLEKCSHYLNWPGGSVLPDVYLVNSGLHDGLTNFLGDLTNDARRAGPHHGTTAAFSASVSKAMDFFALLARLPGDIAGAARLDARAAKGGVDDDSSGGAPPPEPPRQPRFLWRQTVATAGPRRATLHHNPQKMEVYAHIVTARLLEASRDGPIKWSFLDEFDMSYPFHYDLEASDHTHYGIDSHNDLRNRTWARVVDQMMLHVALNGLCAR